MNRVKWHLLFFVFICAGFTLNFSGSHTRIPTDCDEFGYLNLAKAFSENRTYEMHTSRPYLNELIDTLRAVGIHDPEFDYMVAPLSYYMIEGSKQIINMYHPGTSYVLSYFPISIRKYLFPLCAIAFFAWIPFLLVGKRKDDLFNGFDLFYVLILLLMFLPFSPIRTEFTRVNSLALTFGLLTAAGIFLKNKPWHSIMCIALASNFRLGNIVMLGPVLVFIKWPNALNSKQIIAFFKRSIWYMVSIFICLLPYFIYVTKLLGSPFSQTYSPIDTNFLSGGKTNFSYYINMGQLWFIFHLLLISIFIWFRHKKTIDARTFIGLILFPVLNYTFYMYKSITMNYYVYASFFILLGACFHYLNQIEVNPKLSQYFKYFSIGMVSLILIAGAIDFSKHEHPLYAQAALPYQKALSKYPIVWGDLYAGTTEYVCGNSGFMYKRATPRARIKAMQFLYNKKYNQVVLLDDIPVDRNLIPDELKQAGLPFQIIKDEFMGDLILIN